MDNFDKKSSSSLSLLSLDKTASSSRKTTRAGKKIFKETRRRIYRAVRRKNCGQGLPQVNSSSHEPEEYSQNSMNLFSSRASLFRLSGENNFGSETCSVTELKYDVDIQEWSNNGCLGLVVDEEEIFNMPVLLDSMAEGMLLTPLAMKKGFNWSHEVDDEFAMTLWCD